jgi:hypothetical protein
MTSIVRFIKEAEVGSVFDDHATKAMGEAFEAACKDLDEAGQPERCLRGRRQTHHRNCEIGRT